MKDNLFSEKTDAALYLFTYIVFPMISTFVGLSNITDAAGSLAYWYLTILCNALCCLHDCTNRWEKTKSVKNGKLSVMIIGIVVIIIYCIVEMFLALNELEHRLDFILALYIVIIITAGHDIFKLISAEISFK